MLIKRLHILTLIIFIFVFTLVLIELFLSSLQIYILFLNIPYFNLLNIEKIKQY